MIKDKKDPLESAVLREQILKQYPPIADKSKIKEIECRHAFYIPPSKEIREREYNPSDYHLVKEQVHLKDGTIVPNVRLIKDFKRPFYTTKLRFRDHKQKREKEKIEHLDKWESTQSTLYSNICQALGERNYRGDPKKIMASPYLYGTDMSSTAYLKEQYRRKWKDVNTYYSLAVFDIETSMHESLGLGSILMATLSFKNRVITAVRKDYVKGYADVINQIKEKANTYLKEYIEKRQIDLEVVLCDTEGEIIVEIMKRAHLWRPDWIGVWNINFDLPHAIKALEKDGIDPKDVFTDPLVPKDYRRFWYKEGIKIRTTNLGVVKNLAPYEQWHWVDAPASFQWIDNMAVYYLNRIAEQNEPSYKLDYLLDKHLGVRKLRFTETDQYTGPTWHKVMQSEYPLEYVVYNIFDCIGVEEFDEKVLDLCLTTPMAAGSTDMSRFNSQPQRLLTQVYWFLLGKGYIVGNGAGIQQEYDDMTIGLGGWICTMPAHLIKEKGLRCLKQ